MEQFKICKLTSEQEAQIPVHRQQWQQVVLSTERINRKKAMETIRIAYSLIGEKEPKIFFCDSPYSALQIASTRHQHLGRRIEKKLRKPLQEQLESQISQELLETIISTLKPSRVVLEGQMKILIDKQLEFRKFIPSVHWLDISMLFDFGVSVLHCVADQHAGKTVQSMLRNCGWILPYSETCILCDRPTKILFKSFDDGEYLHAEGEPVIQFADGFSISICHRTIT